MSVEIREVLTKKEMKKWVDFPNKMYKKVSTSLNFVENELATEKFWKENEIFKKSITKIDDTVARFTFGVSKNTVYYCFVNFEKMLVVIKVVFGQSQELANT